MAAIPDVSIGLFDEYEDPSVAEFNKQFSTYEVKKFKDPKKQALVEKIMRLPNAIYLDNEDIKRQIMTEFKEKDTVKLIYKWIVKRMEYISKKASAFRDGILTRYSYLPPNKIMKKAKKYAKHLKFTQAEFELFRQMFMINYISPLSNQDIKLETGDNTGALARVFDIKPKEKEQGKLIFDSSESSIVESIVKAAKSNDSLYYYTFVDSINYKDCDTEKYNMVPIKKNTKYTDCVHPVVAAMFIPKIPYFETRFIYQNIARLVQMCYEHQKIDGLYKNLQNSLALDKSQYSDQTGHIITPIKDLQLRANIQIALWRVVLMLRNNHVLDCDCTKLYNALSVYAPDMFVDNSELLNQNSVGIIRRLYNALSVSTLTISRSKIYTPLNYLAETYGINRDTSTVPFVVARDKNSKEFKLLPIKPTIDDEKRAQNEERIKEEEKVSFIYVRPNELSGDKSIDDYINKQDTKFGDSTVKTEYKSASGVVTIIILRTRNVSKKRWRYNGEVMTTFQNLSIEFNTEEISYSPTLYIGTDSNSQFNLRSAVLSSTVKVDTDINGDSASGVIKTRGSSYCIVFPVNGGTPIVYHPYNINEYDPTTGQIIGPFNFIDEAQARAFIKTQAEIVIYANNFNGITD